MDLEEFQHLDNCYLVFILKATNFQWHVHAYCQNNIDSINIDRSLTNFHIDRYLSSTLNSCYVSKHNRTVNYSECGSLTRAFEPLVLWQWGLDNSTLHSCPTIYFTLLTHSPWENNTQNRIAFGTALFSFQYHVFTSNFDIETSVFDQIEDT